MLTTQTILRLLDRDFIVSAFLYLLFVSMLLLADVYSIVYFTGDYGLYLVLGIAASVSLCGVLLTTAVLLRRLRLLRRTVYLSENPIRHYRTIAATILAGLLFLSPGAVSSSLALVCLLPVVRAVPGSLLTLLCRRELTPVYDYLKMEDAEGSKGSAVSTATAPTRLKETAEDGLGASTGPEEENGDTRLPGSQPNGTEHAE